MPKSARQPIMALVCSHWYKYRKSRMTYTLRCWLMLYAVTFLVVLPVLFGQCNHSVYFTLRRHMLDRKPFVRHLVHMDSNRLQIAQEYFASVDQHSVAEALNQRAGHPSTLDIAITIVTVRRDRPPGQSYTPEYVTETVWKLLSQLTDPDIMADFPYTVKILLCNGGTNPAHNKPALQLGKYIKLVNISGKAPPKNLGERNENEKIDYMVCLNESLKLSPRYVLALEDDAFARDDMWATLKYAISEKLDKHIARDRTVTSNDAAYVKLIHPECKLWYFNLKPSFQAQLELFGLSLLFGTLITIMHEAAVRRLYRADHIRLGCSNWLAWCVFVALTVLAIGRPCMLELRRMFTPHLYSFVPASDRCAIAVLFPNKGARTLIEYLNSTRITQSYGKDSLMDFMLVDKNLKAYQLFPNSFIHIGQKSSGLARDPFCVY